MSRREKERKESLGALAKFAYSVGGGAPAPAPKPQERASSLPPPKPAPAPPPKPPAKAADPEAERLRRRQMESRRAKLEEERLLRQRRENELARSANLQWRGMSLEGVPASIRRTGFDRKEPDLNTKIGDILGAAKEKEGRAKNRDKGRRQGGR